MLRRTFSVFDQGKASAHFCLVTVPREFSMNRDLEQPNERRRPGRLRRPCSSWKLYVAAE